MKTAILISGLTLIADSNQNQSGDLTLAAKENVTIIEAVDTLSEQREEIHGKAEASLVVQHQAVEVAKAAQALQKSTKKLIQAEQDYKQYKKGLDSLEPTLATLEQEYADKKPGVTFADIEELRDLIAQVESDEAWYIAGVALATEDVVSKTTGLTQQTAALATSVSSCTYCFGFNAGLQLDIEASKNSSSSQQTTSTGSTLSGQNIVITAGNNEGDQLNIQGSQIAANDGLSLAANEINLTASKDTLNTKSEMESGQISAQMTVFGASTGINVNASYNRNQSTSASTTHNNTLLSGDTISLTSNQDTNIKGATVTAESSLEANIGGDLNIASVQDRYTSNSQGAGISGGVSLTGGQTSDGTGSLPQGVLTSMDGAGELTGTNGGINASNGRTSSKQTVLTSLTSGGDANITVGGNTDVTGALIATIDEQGNDIGKLNLTTDSLTYADLSNTHYSQNQSLAVNAGYGIKQPTESGSEPAQSTPNNTSKDDSKFNSSSYQYTNTSSYDKGKTLATIGQGTLTISDSEASNDLTALNRDTEQTEKDLFTVDRIQGNVDVTVDHRLLNLNGLNEIANDITEPLDICEEEFYALILEDPDSTINYDLYCTGQDKVIETTGNRSRLNIIGALNLSDIGATIVHDYESINSENIVRFFCKLRESYPLAHKLHIILDGAGYHRSDLVKDAAFVLNIELHYLPPYSPNLNPIERLWKVMNEQSRNNVYFKNKRDFKEAIDQFFTVTLPEIAGSLTSRINDNFQVLKPAFSS